MLLKVGLMIQGEKIIIWSTGFILLLVKWSCRGWQTHLSAWYSYMPGLTVVITCMQTIGSGHT